jgi:hypothetical protein
MKFATELLFVAAENLRTSLSATVVTILKKLKNDEESDEQS